MVILKRQYLNVPKKHIYLAALLFSFAVLLQVISTEQGISFIVQFRNVVLFTAIYLFWALTIDYINGIVRSLEVGRSKFIQFIERLISVVILVIANLIVTNIIYYGYLLSFTDLRLEDVYKDFEPFILKSIIIRFFDIVVIGLVLKIIEAYKTVQEQKLKVISLENQLHLSQLEALRNQLDPHFLFNTLHTLNTLIGYDDRKARSMVIKVTNLLRKILDKRKKQLITFEEELDYFTNYLEIEEERFHDRLEIQIDVNETAKELMVPTLILQPLIENAFKHGIAQLEGRGEIKLLAYIKENRFTIQLSNTINKDNQNAAINSTKMGLDNLQSRLSQTYEDNYKFSTMKKNDVFTATIEIILKDTL